MSRNWKIAIISAIAAMCAANGEWMACSVILVYLIVFLLRTEGEI